MKSYKEYLDEKVRDQFWYHNTSLLAFISMIRHGNKLGIPTDFDAIQGYKSVKRGWVSFTRSPRYTAAPGAGRREITLVFSPEKVKSRYKTSPYADQFVTKSRDQDDFVKGAEARFESEEKVMGPIEFRHGLIRVDITREAYNSLKETIETYKKHYEKEKESFMMAKKGFIYHSIKKEYIKPENEKQEKRLKQKIESGVNDYWLKLAVEVENIIKRKDLNII